MKLILSAALVLVTFLTCYGEEIYFSLWPPQSGKVIYLTVRSQHPFNFDQEKAFGSKRNIAIAQYTPLYTYTPERTESTKRKMRELIQKVPALQAQGQKEAMEFEKAVRKEFGVALDADAVSRLLQYGNLKHLLEAVLAIEESILQGRIVEDPKPLQGKKTIEVLFPRHLGTVAYPTTEVVTLEQARETLQNKIFQVFWQVERSVLDPIVQIVLATMAPNLRYDRVENDRRIEEIIRRYPSKTIPYSTGEVLVPFRKVLNEEDILLISAHQEEEKKIGYKSAPWVMFSIVLAVGLYNLLLTRTFQSWHRGRPPRLLHLSVLIIGVLLSNLFLLFTSFPVQALPLGFVPLLLILLYPERVAVTLTTLLNVLLAGLFTGRTVPILFFFGFGAVVAIVATPMIKRRSHLVLPSLMVGFANVITILFAQLDGNGLVGWLGDANKGSASLFSGIAGMDLLPQIGWAFTGGIASGPLALLLLPFLERMWNTASTFELFKYTDLDHPLMKDLLTKAPGTYQHSMTVAYLAQAASDRIGADTLLVRIGAYYHDIGKTADPRKFVENQFGGPNPHENLPAEESVSIITDHVASGVDLAREARLPEVILEFIQQHHGTQLLEYFYDKACGSGGSAKVRDEGFRYPGPKPQRVETAILMITDAVEAASRTIHEPTRENIDGVVRHILERRIADGQFDECDLSTHDIAGIRDTLVSSLAVSFHSRVEYPWQKNGEGRKEEAAETPSSPLNTSK